MTELDDKQLGQVLIHRVDHRHRRAEPVQCLEQVTAALGHAVGEFLHRDRFGHLDVAHLPRLPSAAAMAAMLLLARAAECGEAAGADTVVAVERTSDGQLALATVVDPAARRPRGQAALAALLIVDDRGHGTERPQSDRARLDRAKCGFLFGFFLVLETHLLELDGLGFFDRLAAVGLLERLHPLFVGFAKHRREALLRGQPVGLRRGGGSAPARWRCDGTRPAGRGRQCRANRRGGCRDGRGRGSDGRRGSSDRFGSRSWSSGLDAPRYDRALDGCEHHRRRHDARLSGGQRPLGDGRRRRRGRRRRDGGPGNRGRSHNRRRRRRRDLDDRLLARGVARAVEDSRALDLDDDRLRPAVREALLDLADLDRLVETEGGAHAELGFGVVAHLRP